MATRLQPAWCWCEKLTWVDRIMLTFDQHTGFPNWELKHQLLEKTSDLFVSMVICGVGN